MKWANEGGGERREDEGYKGEDEGREENAVIGMMKVLNQMSVQAEQELGKRRKILEFV